MAQYKITVTRCNGCGKTDLHDGASFASHKETKRGRTIDICEECYNKDRYYCQRCGRVHNDSDEEICEELQKEWEASRRHFNLVHQMSEGLTE